MSQVTRDPFLYYITEKTVEVYKKGTASPASPSAGSPGHAAPAMRHGRGFALRLPFYQYRAGGRGAPLHYGTVAVDYGEGAGTVEVDAG